MEQRKYVNIPFPSLVIREYSLFIALMCFFAQNYAEFTVLMSILCCWGIFRVLMSIIQDNDYSSRYKTLMTSVFCGALGLILYSFFFSEKYVQINHLIAVVGLCIACGSVFVVSIIILIKGKKIENSNRKDEIVHRFLDATHVFMLYVVILCNL